MPVKQEIYQEHTAGQTIQCAAIVSCNIEAAPVPLNQPIPLFPTSLFPPLLLRQSQVASPSASSEPSARQQEQETREALKDCVKAMKSGKGACPDGSDSDEEMRGNNVKEPAKESAAVKSVLNTDLSIAAPDKDDGNESDDSVEMIGLPNLVVIDVDESETEEDSHDSVSNVPVHLELPQTSVELSSASTQTSQQNDDDR